jgi:hypothetical protein
MYTPIYNGFKKIHIKIKWSSLSLHQMIFNGMDVKQISQIYIKEKNSYFFPSVLLKKRQTLSYPPQKKSTT